MTLYFEFNVLFVILARIYIGVYHIFYSKKQERKGAFEANKKCFAASWPLKKLNGADVFPGQLNNPIVCFKQK